MRNLKGQLSVEFMIVFVGMLLIVAAVTYPLYDGARADADRLNKLTEVKSVASTLANAINALYANGPGSKQTVEYSLPEGAVLIYAHMDIDGVTTTDGSISLNGRMDVQARLDFDEDNVWDNKLDTVVHVDTLLPSRWYENGAERDDNWITENGIVIEDWNLSFDPSKRTYHKVTLEYSYLTSTSLSGTVLWTDTIDHDSDFETTLFGYKLDVGVDNDAENIVIDFEFGSTKIDDYEGPPPFTLQITEGGITVTVAITVTDVTVSYNASSAQAVYPRYIAITDETLERG